ncbi:porin family protein [Mucilaginibacter xinganensis]|uniref:Outer membrane protein beta-barrel domain-containing protein n=1 Tax=Mucilaginibacter xinganensis TaxID=1234841 RepID=A0A223NSE8_9SPHI|nr:outer membrane beta-barrel protein [Mucilaginibacter xinganensis]ASU32431.1 Outer membrane protein beta-barrel domain-containing protein [Mucilaginibacter xinganensis]
MKKYILFFVIVIAAIGVKAQAGYNYYEFGVGGGASYERGYTNIPRQDNNIGFNLNLTYNYNPYLPIELEIQKGQLSGGGLTVALDRYGRKFTNNFLALYLHADIQLGSFIDYEHDWFLNAVKGFYVGSGVGFVRNNNTVQRTNVILANGPTTYIFPGSDQSTNISVPLRVGYEFKIFDSYQQPAWAIDIGYVHNIVFGEGLDGYDDPSSKFKNNATNQYRQFTIGFKYFFGNTVSYTKLVRDYGF